MKPAIWRNAYACVYSANFPENTRLTMYKTVFIFALMLAMQAQAKDMSRCGTDDFGNTVCMDKNGVMTTVSFSSEENEVAASGVPAAAMVDDKENARPRCGTDPFGNNVCR